MTAYSPTMSDGRRAVTAKLDADALAGWEMVAETLGATLTAVLCALGHWYLAHPGHVADGSVSGADARVWITEEARRIDRERRRRRPEAS